LSEIATAFARAAGFKGKVETEPWTGPFPDATVMYDSTKAKTVLGWRARYSGLYHQGQCHKCRESISVGRQKCVRPKLNKQLGCALCTNIAFVRYYPSSRGALHCTQGVW